LTQDNDKLKPDSENEESREPADFPEETSASEETTENDSDAPVEDIGEPPVPEAETIYEPPVKPSFEMPEPSKNSGGGLTQWILLILIAILGTGGFFFYQEQNKFQQSVLERLTQLETQVNSLQSNQDLSRSNADQLESLNRGVASLKNQVNQTLQGHQSSLSMLDEDIVRLKDELNTLRSQAGMEQDSAPVSDRSEVTRIPEEPMASLREEREPRGVEAIPPVAPGLGDSDDSEELEPEPQRPQQAQEYIDFVETTTEKFFRLVKEGFVNLWRWFASMFE